MLLAATPNPSLDRILQLDSLSPGRVQRALRVRVSAGGKGCNVVRAALRLGLDAEAVCPVGGPAGDRLLQLAAAESLPLHASQLADGHTRTCLLINHNAADTTVINEPGPLTAPACWTTYLELVRRRMAGARSAAVCGSFPPGLDESGIDRLVDVLLTVGGAVYVDTHGAPLARILERPRGLTLKINAAEFQAAAGDPSRRGLQALLSRGAHAVLLTESSRGAVVATPDGCWRVPAPRLDPVSSVGSGDAFLAGYVAALLRDADPAQALRRAVACGAANTLSDWPGDIDSGEVERLEGDLKVEEVE